METWTKEVAAIGQAAVDQNVARSTTRRLCNIFLYLPESTIYENAKEILSSTPSENLSLLYFVQF
jgi:hypothetical protein